VAKNLKEALLEQMATLQERGLAPGEIPVEQEDEPSYAQYEGESDRRAFGGDRDGDARRGSRAPRVRNRAPAVRPREQREIKEPRANRERREGRGSRDALEIPPGLVGPAPAPATRPPRPMGPPRPFNQAGFAPPGQTGPRPAPRSDMLRRNAERLQREQADLAEVRQLLTQHSGETTDDAALDRFFSQLAVETGALPPLNVVLEALRSAGGGDPAEVGNQVRAHYRRARSRPAPRPVAVGQ
jgi:hypothetical protein